MYPLTALSFSRQGDDTGRPHKRIKLEDSELAKESDVSSLVKPQLGFFSLIGGGMMAKEGQEKLHKPSTFHSVDFCANVLHVVARFTEFC